MPYLLPVNNEYSTLFVNSPNVPSFEPSVYERICTSLGVPVVSIHETWPAYAYFSSFAWFLDEDAVLVDQPSELSAITKGSTTEKSHFASTLGSSFPTLPESSRSGHFNVDIHPASVIP